MKSPFYLNNVSYVTVTKFRLFQVLYSVSALKDPELRFFLSKDPVLQGKKYGSVWKSAGNLYSVQVRSYIRTGTVPAVFVKIHSLFCRWSYCTYRSVNRNTCRIDVADAFIYLFFRLLRFTLTTASWEKTNLSRYVQLIPCTILVFCSQFKFLSIDY